MIVDPLLHCDSQIPQHIVWDSAPLVSPSATSAGPGAGRPAEALEHLVRFRFRRFRCLMMFDDV